MNNKKRWHTHEQSAKREIKLKHTECNDVGCFDTTNNIAF